MFPDLSTLFSSSTAQVTTSVTFILVLVVPVIALTIASLISKTVRRKIPQVAASALGVGRGRRGRRR